MEELKAIASSDDAAIRAHRILGAKNSLTEVDSRQIEDAFREGPQGQRMPEALTRAG
jgi:hypothetical protein